MCSASGPSLAARTSVYKVHACKVHACKVHANKVMLVLLIWLVSVELYNRYQASETTHSKKIASGGNSAMQ